MIRPERILVSAAFRGLGEAVEEAAGVFAGERVEPVRLARLSSNGCVTKPKEREIGLTGFAAPTQLTMADQSVPT